MCLTIVWGAYELLANRGSKNKSLAKSDNPVGELKKFVGSVSKKLVNEKVSKEYRYLIGQAGQNWTKDPFISSTEPLKKEQTTPQFKKESTSPQAVPQYIYSGYLDIGKIKFAIINGIEYTEGEAINSGGYYIKKIAPLQVVIGKVNSRETIQLPITEIDPTIGNQTP